MSRTLACNTTEVHQIGRCAWRCPSQPMSWHQAATKSSAEPVAILQSAWLSTASQLCQMLTELSRTRQPDEVTCRSSASLCLQSCLPHCKLS